jgi:hypothetical protein
VNETRNGIQCAPKFHGSRRSKWTGNDARELFDFALPLMRMMETPNIKTTAELLGYALKLRIRRESGAGTFPASRWKDCFARF